MSNIFIYEFDGKYYNLEHLQNEDLKEWIKDNADDKFNYDQLESDKDDIERNYDFDYSAYSDYAMEDCLEVNWDSVRAEQHEEYEEIMKKINIIEYFDYIDLKENTEEYSRLMIEFNKYDK